MPAPGLQIGQMQLLCQLVWLAVGSLLMLCCPCMLLTWPQLSLYHPTAFAYKPRQQVGLPGWLLLLLLLLGLVFVMLLLLMLQLLMQLAVELELVLQAVGELGGLSCATELCI
jgi:hypothetical protein